MHIAKALAALNRTQEALEDLAFALQVSRALNLPQVDGVQARIEALKAQMDTAPRR